MYKKISKSHEIIERIKNEGKVTPMNSEDDIAKIISINKYMKKVRRDYIVKEIKSYISASEIILNC
jgi:hypothetical protein